MSAAWTHTMGYDDVRAMLRLAEPGKSVSHWHERIRGESRLFTGSRLTTQLRIATTILRPDAQVISESAFLTDLARFGDAAARDLIYARYLASVGPAVAFARQFLHPNGEREESTSITRDRLTAHLDRTLGDCAPATRNRTRSAIGAHFQAAGIVRIANDGTLIPTRRLPAHAALLHLFVDELAERREASDAWLAHESLAAALFGLEPKDVSEAVRRLVDDGRLHRSWLAGEQRILAA